MTQPEPLSLFSVLR